MRVVAGKFANTTLTSPGDSRVRPTAEPVRAALLDLLAPHVPGARVLDLFAGTGAVGIEAISRGARSCDFVESGPAALHALKANVTALRLRERTRIFKKDAVPFAGMAAEDAYEIAFADPPYGSRVLDRIIAIWRDRKFSRILAVEHARSHDVPPGALRKAYDDSVLTIYQR